MAISEEARKLLKDAYLSDPYMKLKELSEISESVCGSQVIHDTLRSMSWAEGWGIEKRRMQMGKDGMPRDMADQADDLQSIVYAQIMDPEKTHNPSDLSRLIGIWETVRLIAPKRRSGKSSRQQIIEATRMAMEKVSELSSRREDER